MTRLYLVRHAIAEEATAEIEAGRALTAKGRRRFRRIARLFAAMDEPVEVLCASPHLRAAQSAEMLAMALGLDEIRTLDELSPEATLPKLLRALGALHARSVALVGHKRLLSDLAAELTGVTASSRIHLKRGMILRIDVPRIGFEVEGAPRWCLDPEGSLRERLPLVEAA